MDKSVSAKRKVISMEMTLWEKIKTSVKIVKSLVAENEFVQAYKYCYPNLWKNVCEYHNNMVCWNKQRISKGMLSVYSYSSSEDYLYIKSQRIGKYSVAFLRAKGFGDNKDEIKDNIRKIALRKLKNRNIQERRRERYKQHMEPTYVVSHINAYFQVRKRNPLDVDTRYLIIHELAKYKCDGTIRFLRMLVRCEKNLPLQHYAWECLNDFGIVGEHKGRRKGKKNLTHLKRFLPISTPQDLLKAIYNSPLEQMKKYDLFLSHSYDDKDKLIKLKDRLNRQGINVYMDWVNDKDELPRKLTCAETATVIVERIKASKAILYIHTESSLESKWTPWELGIAYALSKPIFLYRPEPTVADPEYLQLCQNVIITNDSFMIDSTTQTPLVEWLKNI